MHLGPVSLRLGRLALAPARVAGGARVSMVTRSSLLAAPSMRMPLRALNSQASCYAAASSHAMTNATPSSSGPLGSNLEPSDILAFLNSPEFSSYQSASDAHGALLGDDATLAATALTHESWMHGVQGHNRRLAFIGMFMPWSTNSIRTTCFENIYVAVPF